MAWSHDDRSHDDTVTRWHGHMMARSHDGTVTRWHGDYRRPSLHYYHFSIAVLFLSLLLKTAMSQTMSALLEENRMLGAEMNRLEDLLSQSRAERDEVGIKYDAVSERVSTPNAPWSSLLLTTGTSCHSRHPRHLPANRWKSNECTFRL